MTAPAQPDRVEVVAYLHVMHMEGEQTNERLTFSSTNPFGVAGQDYDEDYPVTSAELCFAAATAEASAAEIERLKPEAETYRQMRDIAISDLGCEGILEALEELADVRAEKLAAKAENARLREALGPFAEIAKGEVYEHFRKTTSSTFRITDGHKDRCLTFINAECFDAARAALADVHSPEVERG